MKEIELTRGKVTMVDDEDYEYLSQFKWRALHCFDGSWRAIRSDPTSPKQKGNIFMHREIMNCPKELVVDHINRSSLDNRRENLRIATYAENSRNSTMSKNKVLRLKGVVEGYTSSKKGKRYYANITKDGVHYYLGVFNNPIDAALTYDKKAIELFGEFAATNVSLGLL